MRLDGRVHQGGDVAGREVREQPYGGGVGFGRGDVAGAVEKRREGWPQGVGEAVVRLPRGPGARVDGLGHGERILFLVIIIYVSIPRTSS